VTSWLSRTGWEKRPRFQISELLQINSHFLLAEFQAVFSLQQEERDEHDRSGLELLKKSEGFRDHTYQDVAGFQTIGFGHRLLPDENYPGEISLALGEAILAKDVRNAETAIQRLVKVPLTQGQFDALVDFVFNLGAGRLAGSTLLKYLNSGKYDAAAWQLLAWSPRRQSAVGRPQGAPRGRVSSLGTNHNPKGRGSLTPAASEAWLANSD
jgi:lysozyme